MQRRRREKEERTRTPTTFNEALDTMGWPELETRFRPKPYLNPTGTLPEPYLNLLKPNLKGLGQNPI